MVYEELPWLRNVIPHVDRVKWIAWRSVLPVYHALDYLWNLIILVVVLLLVEVLDQAKEFLHLVDFLDALHQEMLGDLAQFCQIFPLGEELGWFFVDENSCSVVVGGG